MQANTKDKGGQMDEKKGPAAASSDSDSSVPEMECETCGGNFSSIKSYEAHMNGKKHHKKVAQAKFLSKQMMNDENGRKSDDDHDDDGDSKLHCEVCDKYFSGHVSLMTHLQGTIHAKYVKKQKLKEKMKDMPELVAEENKENGAGEDSDDGIFQKPFARCAVCKKEFSGPESFAAHVKSAVHKKKVEVSKKFGNSETKKHEDGTKNSDVENDVNAKCEMCDKSFSGPIPYHIHMKSSIHKKNLEKQKVAEEMKQFCDKYDPETGFVCKECKKTFTDPVNFKYHLSNNSHSKQRAKSALKEFLNSHPEIEFVTPFGEQNAADGGGADSDDSSEDYYLICKVCHASFSGPESAKEHVKSKKHISLKKEKETKKLLRQQKKKIDASRKLESKAAEKTGDKTNTAPLKNDVSARNDSEKHSAGDDFELI